MPIHRPASIRLFTALMGGILLLLLGAALGVQSKNYKVKSGDTLGSIAREHQVKVADLVKANSLKDPNALRVGQSLVIPMAGAPKSYRIQKGDTLGAIAKTHNIALSTLANYNKISRPDRIRVGQTILIPTDADYIARKRPTLPTSVKAQLDKIPLRSGRWKYIVIHHSATRAGNPKGMDEYHRVKRRMKNGLAYHFVIGNGNGMRNGEISVGNRWKGQLNGGHLKSESQNTYSIGICLVGNFDLTRPGSTQMASLEALTLYLMDRCKLSSARVKTHKQINTLPTRCPGRNFPTTQFIQSL